MKRFIIAAALLVVMLWLATNVYAVVKCEPDGKGGMCCWDPNQDGPWKPIIC